LTQSGGRKLISCIDLKKQFGADFKVEYEESYRAERGDSARVRDPWLLIIPCQHGHIFPFGGNRLAASTNRRGAIAKRLASLPNADVFQDGDDGISVTFGLADFDSVSSIIRPRRRRKLSPEQRAKLIEQGRHNLTKHRRASSDSTDRKCDGPAPSTQEAA
jgi:hypothetical protein